MAVRAVTGLTRVIVSRIFREAARAENLFRYEQDGVRASACQAVPDTDIWNLAKTRYRDMMSRYRYIPILNLFGTSAWAACYI